MAVAHNRVLVYYARSQFHWSKGCERNPSLKDGRLAAIGAHECAGPAVLYVAERRWVSLAGGPSARCAAFARSTFLFARPSPTPAGLLAGHRHRVVRYLQEQTPEIRNLALSTALVRGRPARSPPPRTLRSSRAGRHLSARFLFPDWSLGLHPAATFILGRRKPLPTFRKKDCHGKQ
jgi:hypothetical protein